MSNDDSFIDADEIVSLYSSKKVTDTFKAQLKKIAANNHRLTDASSHVNNEEIRWKKKEEKIINNEIPGVMDQRKVNIAEPIEIIDDDSPNTSVEIDNGVLLEDSIEIISEFTPSKPTKRSQRLKNKREQESRQLNQLVCTNSNKPVNKRSVRSKNKRGKRKHPQNGKAVDEITLDDSLEATETEDELNPVLTVKVIWKSVNIKKFQIRKFQKLSHIFECLSKEENVPEDKIMLSFNNVKIDRSDTPETLNLQVYHFLDGGVLSESSNLCETTPHKSEQNVDSVTLKFQDINKKIVKLNLNKNDKLKVVMIKCSEQLEVPLDKIKFYFDGELLQPSETPASLGLENEEVIDLKICS